MRLRTSALRDEAEGYHLKKNARFPLTACYNVNIALLSSTATDFFEKDSIKLDLNTEMPCPYWAPSM